MKFIFKQNHTDYYDVFLLARIHSIMANGHVFSTTNVEKLQQIMENGEERERAKKSDK